MSDETEVVAKWLNAADWRKPTWPLGGYAPGDYMSKCIRCEQQFIGMDKRALNCLPCAIDSVNEWAKQMRLEMNACKAENEVLRAAIRIVSPGAST